MISLVHACPECGYEFLGAGGRSALFAGCTWTIACLDCRELEDVVVDPLGATEQLPPDDPRKHAKGTHGLPAAADLGSHADHRVQEWTHPGPCPKCGTELARDETTVICSD